MRTAYNSIVCANGHGNDKDLKTYFCMMWLIFLPYQQIFDKADTRVPR